MRPISIEQAKKNRDEKIAKAQSLLADAVERLQTSDGWREMLGERHPHRVRTVASVQPARR